jgi:hypothetical protein
MHAAHDDRDANEGREWGVFDHDAARISKRSEKTHWLCKNLADCVKTTNRTGNKQFRFVPRFPVSDSLDQGAPNKKSRPGRRGRAAQFNGFRFMRMRRSEDERRSTSLRLRSGVGYGKRTAAQDAAPKRPSWLACQRWAARTTTQQRRMTSLAQRQGDGESC